MNILMIGRNDPAGMMITFANALNRYTEHTARVISLETRYNMEYEYDIQLGRLPEEDYGEIEHLLKTSDLIHFHMLVNEHIMIGPLVVREYVSDKPMYHHHHGHPDFLINADRYQDRYRKLGRRCGVSTPDLLKLIPDAVWLPNMVPLQEADFLPRPDHLGDQSEVRVVQAPTRKWHKHTAEFERVMERISADHPNARMEILTGYSYRGCLKQKRRSHVVFDHMNGWFGISSLESLAHGIPVIAGLDEWCTEQMKAFAGTDSLPWVVARTEEELESQIRDLVNNPGRRVDVGAASRTFMENHWSERDALAVLLDEYAKI
jgi:glycosyltransferase involved in cell wall biosynthesis